MPKAVSKYKQVRITLTEQEMRLNGTKRLITVRVAVKPLNEPWHHRQTILATTLRDTAPLVTIEDVYTALLHFVSEQPFPGDL